MEGGYFFFILDSFDEIPAVLDHDENSWLIEELSNSIAAYVLSGKNSRGIISSRLFRQPKISVRERSVFEIQPFSNERIMQAISLTSTNPDKLIKTVLTERNDLGSIARNPFLLHLIINHFNQTGVAPSSQAEMFETFIDLNLQQARNAYGSYGLTDAEIYGICEDIAAAMFDRTQAGLEIGEPELRNEIELPQLPHVLQFLSQARMGRVAPVSGAFSFSHRRFNEYFLVRRLSSKRTAIPFDAIQTDSRWRDALVLYAEIANTDDAKNMVEHGWHFASKLGVLSIGLQRSAFIESRHALRFLVEGFRNRSSLISEHKIQLIDIIRSKLASESDYIEKKTVLEAIALLPTESASKIIVHGLDKHPGWISEEAASAARYLKRITPMLARKLYVHCIRRNGFAPLVEARRQLNILSISDSFKSVTYLLRWYLYDAYKSYAGLALLIATVMIAQNEFWTRTVAFISLAVLAIPVLFPLFSLVRTAVSSSSEEAKRASKKSFPDKFISLLKLKTGQFFADYTLLPKLLTGQIVMICVLFLVFDLLGIKENHNPTQMKLRDAPLWLSIFIFTVCVLTALPMRPTVWRHFNRHFFHVHFSIVAIKSLLGVTISAAIMLTILVTTPDYIMRFLAEALATIGLIPFALIICQGSLSCWRDSKRLREIEKEYSFDRILIARNFESMKTSWGRIRYVRWLGEVSIENLSALRRPENIWPDGRRPQFAGDEASTALAQLDARWLDLE